MPNTRQPDDGVCYVPFGGGEGADREPSLAAHPLDAGTVLLTWTDNDDGRVVWGAVTRDAGEAWNVQQVGGEGSFDSVAAFDAGGRAYILYGAAPAGIRLVVSADGGESWDQRVVVDDPAILLWDAMDLAVAPDGPVYVVAQSVSARGIWLWRSDDGAAWEGPQPIHLPAGPGGVHVFPRVVAGADGLVAVSAIAIPSSIDVVVSRDGGRTFGLPAALPAPEGGFLQGEPVVVLPDGSLAAAYAAGAVRLSRSADGTTWDAPQDLFTPPDGATMVWSVLAPGDGGHALFSYGRRNPDLWGVGVAHVGPDGAVTVTGLAGPTEVTPVNPMEATSGGDEYGGAAVAADGSLWLAWSDPREGVHVGVAHLRPAEGSYREGPAPIPT